MLGFLPDPMRALGLALIASIGGLIFLRYVELPHFARTRLSWAWLALTVAAFSSMHIFVFAAIVAIVCWSLRKLDGESVPAIYIALLPVIPLYRYTIPGVLGINALFDLDYQRVLALTLLIPALLFSKDRGSTKSPIVRNGVDALFYFYCAWLFILALLHRPTPTDSIRAAFEVVAFLLVPYVAVSRLIRTWGQLLSALSAIVFSGILVAFIGVFEERMTWHFYAFVPDLLHMNPQEAFTKTYEIRFNMLRIKSSIDGGLGMFLGIALGGLICLRQGRVIAGWRFWIGAAAICAAILFTGSRGAWIMTGIMLATLPLFHLIKSPTRFLVVAGLGLFAVPVAQRYFLTTRDTFGTFDYRAELYRSGVPLVWERPIFGWDSMQVLFATGRLEHLRQGQGIIDLVNTYLGEALLHGLPGMIVFSGVLFCSVLAVLRRYQRSGHSLEPIQTAVPAFLLSSILGTAFLLVTTSLVGHTSAYLWLLAALCSAYAAMDSPTSTSSPGHSDAGSNVPRRGRRTLARTGKIAR